MLLEFGGFSLGAGNPQLGLVPAPKERLEQLVTDGLGLHQDTCHCALYGLMNAFKAESGAGIPEPAGIPARGRTLQPSPSLQAFVDELLLAGHLGWVGAPPLSGLPQEVGNGRTLRAIRIKSALRKGPRWSANKRRLRFANRLNQVRRAVSPHAVVNVYQAVATVHNSRNENK